MGGNGAFDFGRKHVLSAGDNHVLHAVGYENEPVIIHIAAIARMHPAIHQRGGGLLVQFPIALHGTHAARANFPDIAPCNLIAVLIDDFDLRAWYRTPRRAQFGIIAPQHMIFGLQGGHNRGQFGLAVTLDDIQIRHALDQVDQQAFRHGRGTIGKIFQ